MVFLGDRKATRTMVSFYPAPGPKAAGYVQLTGKMFSGEMVER